MEPTAGHRGPSSKCHLFMRHSFLLPGPPTKPATNVMNRLISALRIVIPVVLLAWIVRQIFHVDPENPTALRDLASQPKNYYLLMLAATAYVTAIVVTFTRWYILVRGLDLPFRLRDAMRLGFIGFFLQFFSLGSVGGDVFKAVFIAREQPVRRPEAVASVFIDRAVGLLALLMMTSLAFVWVGWLALPEELHPVAVVCFLLTGTGCLVVAVLLWTDLSTRPIRQMLRGFPSISAAVLRGEHAVHLYRNRRGWFLLALASGFLSHTLLATSAFFCAMGLFNNAPQFSEQLVIWNIAGSVAAIPLTPGALGTLETAYAYLYKVVPAGGRQLAEGGLTAFSLRIISVITAGIGVVVYWCSRRDVGDLLRQSSSPEKD